MKSIYLINPISPSASYTGGEPYQHYLGRPAILMADLALATVAALVPRDFEVTLCDEACTPVDFDTDAEVIGLTGKANQWQRTRELADEFRRRGKLVMIGGSYASLSPGRVRPHCDVLVRGELEDIAERLFDDLRRGAPQPEYVGGQPDLARTPIPRWELYPNARTTMGSVQTSRGCPFECEFCDVPPYVGRKGRHKPVANVLAELDAVYAAGYRRIFLTDDNLTAYRKEAREVLAAIRDWNRARTDGHVEFLTQLSIDAARDPELLELCASAGLVHVLIGIETSNEESLRETKKRQNLVDLVREVERFVEHGISVSGGAIVGFDHDGPDIFERQLEFLQALPVPHFSLSNLVAPEGTPLFERLRREGRLVEDGHETAASPIDTNIVPKQMSRAELREGLRWLANNLYHPVNYGRRVLRFVELLGERRDPGFAEGAVNELPLREIDFDSMQLVARIPSLGPDEARMYAEVMQAVRKKPAARSFVGVFFVLYMHTRCMYEQEGIWDPSLLGPRVAV